MEDLDAGLELELEFGDEGLGVGVGVEDGVEVGGLEFGEGGEEVGFLSLEVGEHGLWIGEGGWLGGGVGHGIAAEDVFVEGDEGVEVAALVEVGELDGDLGSTVGLGLVLGGEAVGVDLEDGFFEAALELLLFGGVDGGGGW